MIEIDQWDVTVQDIENLKTSDEGILMPESDYGLGEIYYINGFFELYEIPMYGGEPGLALKSDDAQEILDELKTWI